MAVAELKEALALLTSGAVFWVPGLVGGLLGATFWLVLNLYGTFFAGRLIVILGLVLLIFTTGVQALVRDNGGDTRTLLAAGMRYYFRVLLPKVLVLSAIFIVFLVLVTTFSLFGISDISIAAALAGGFMIPALIVTFFSDTAAIFEDLRVFDSVRRSMHLVFLRSGDVTAFLAVYLVTLGGIVISLVIVWESVLYDRLEPLSRYNATEIQSFGPGQFIALIGPDGIWITAVMIFLCLFLVIPILYVYKACFFRTMAAGTSHVQGPAGGEYDSKGRWYKY